MVGFLALAANVASVLILMRWRGGDATVTVDWFNSGWPDLIVAIQMVSLFFNSSVQILRQARAERQADHRTHS